MDNVRRLRLESSDARDFAGRYLDYLSGLLARLDRGSIAEFIAELEAARDRDATIFFIGNGGSAATASHMANDLGLDVMKGLADERPFRVLSLTECVPVITAIANDDCYEAVFETQLKVHWRDGDVLVAISASGNSPNLLRAVEWVRRRGGRTLCLVGFDGGRLKEHCDVSVLVSTPPGEYGPVEDVHMVLDHLTSAWLRYAGADRSVE